MSHPPRKIRANPSGAKTRVKAKPSMKNEKTTRERFRRRSAMKPSPQNSRTIPPSRRASGVTVVEALLPPTFVVLCCDATTTGDGDAQEGRQDEPRLGPLHFRRIDGAHGRFALCAFEDAARSRSGLEPLLGVAGFMNFDEMISISPGGLKSSSSGEPAMNWPGYFDPSEPPNRPGCGWAAVWVDRREGLPPCGSAAERSVPSVFGVAGGADAPPVDLVRRLLRFEARDHRQRDVDGAERHRSTQAGLRIGNRGRHQL